MSNTEIAKQWVQPNVSGLSPERRAFYMRASYARWTTIGQRLLERRAALRTANRRFRVHNGLSLKGA